MGLGSETHFLGTQKAQKFGKRQSNNIDKTSERIQNFERIIYFKDSCKKGKKIVTFEEFFGFNFVFIFGYQTIFQIFQSF